MPCEPLRDKDGKIMGFMCSRKKIKEEKQKCYKCGSPATVLCDAPKGNNSFGKSCDIPMCRKCANHIGPDNDVCDHHFNEFSVKKAQANRVNLVKWGWEINKNYTCAACGNEEFNEDAKFCRICGTEIKRED
jgi:ribosomal protein L37E